MISNGIVIWPTLMALKPPTRVIITRGVWVNEIGILEDRIPGTDWFNVRLTPFLRLALTESEFTIQN